APTAWGCAPSVSRCTPRTASPGSSMSKPPASSACLRPNKCSASFPEPVLQADQKWLISRSAVDRPGASLAQHAKLQARPRARFRQRGERVVAGFVEVVRERPGALRFADPAPVEQPLHA